MAEFQEVIKQMKRMCAHFGPTCNGCPLWLEKGTDEFCGEEPNNIHSDPALVEAVVMQWAAENPEPVYPTWGEWLESIEVIKYNNRADSINYLIRPTHKTNTQIPADIAEKLGIKPEEG